MKRTDLIPEDGVAFYPNQIPIELDLLSRKRFENVLEVGCGRGVLHALHQGLTVVSLDFSLNALQKAKSRLKTFRNWDCVMADAMHLPFRTAAIGLLLCLETIDYFESPVGFLKDANRVIDKEGALLLSTRNASSAHHVILHIYAGFYKVAVWLGYRKPTRLQADDRRAFLTANSLASILRQTGFTNELWKNEMGILVLLDALWTKLALPRPKRELIQILLSFDTKPASALPRSLASGWTIVCTKSCMVNQ